jgi:murein L,D-transpeptidase YcbB/YkuD
VAAVVVAELLARKLAPSPDAVEQAWLTQLIAHYAARERSPHWVDSRGVRVAARQAVDELLRADDFALEPARLGIPPEPRAAAEPAELANYEIALSLAIARYAWHARGGRLDPTQISLWLDYKPKAINAADVLKAIVSAADPATGLKSLHPQHSQFEALRQAYLRERGGDGAAASRGPGVDIPMGVRIKPGRRHPDVALARLRLGKPAADGDDTLLDGDFQNALFDFMNNVAGIHYGRGRGIDDEVRLALNGGRIPRAGGNKAMMDLLKANMERWRWLPSDLGDLYIWNNLPEFETRIVKDNAIVHRESIIIGQPDTQTPVFSDEMLRVIFNPDWNVPESIKLSTIWPNLRGGDYGVLKRRGMRIVHEGKEINPARLKYAELNARDVPIVMGPGSGNPLGKFKFVFPNKHDVYMHDTTSKGLFGSKERTFSHGCIRVKNPQRFAEVVLAMGKGWNDADVAWQARAKNTVRIELDRKIPVHNTYFTVVADATGALRKVRDVYGHDKRVSDALNGVPWERIAASDPARAQLKKNQDLASGAIVVAPPANRAASRAKPRPKPVARAAPPSIFFAPPPRRPNFAARSGLSRVYRRSRPRGVFFLW